jgi:hypothetical protein
MHLSRIDAARQRHKMLVIAMGVLLAMLFGAIIGTGAYNPRPRPLQAIDSNEASRQLGGQPVLSKQEQLENGTTRDVFCLVGDEDKCVPVFQ